MILTHVSQYILKRITMKIINTSKINFVYPKINIKKRNLNEYWYMFAKHDLTGMFIQVNSRFGTIPEKFL